MLGGITANSLDPGGGGANHAQFQRVKLFQKIWRGVA